MALRNIAYDYEDYKKVEKKPRIKLIKNKNIKKNVKVKANRVSLVFATLSIFAMLVVVNYRYNIISEKNLKVQRLEMAQVEAEGLLTAAEVEYSRMVDIVEVEAYAKQQLGMQEPEKNQMVYLGSDYDKQYISNDTQGFFSSIINTVKQMISEIF